MGGYREKSMFELKIDNSDKEILVSPQLLCNFCLVSSGSIIFSKDFFPVYPAKGFIPFLPFIKNNYINSQYFIYKFQKRMGGRP